MQSKVPEHRKEKWRFRKETIALVGILFVGCMVRLIALGSNPMGLHQDEAYSAYNAWSVLYYGVDSYGYTRPVYYTVWGSGMSVLYSYLTMPFLALFGTTVWAIRLPQAILGCLTILAVYGLGKEMYEEKTGLLFALLIAINPWHIKLSRFGLDASTAVPFFVFAVYFLCRYLNGKRESLWPAVLCFGFTLYSYALTWVAVSLFLLCVLIFFRKRISFDRQLVGGIVILGVMALPLILFLLVNFDLIPEIRTGLFSIPKLPTLRTGEMAISLGAFKRRFLWLVAMLWSQHDDMWWMTDAKVGSYYYASVPFFVLGIVCFVKQLLCDIKKKKKMPLYGLLGIWFVLSFALGCGIDMAKFHKVNLIHIPIILFGGLGVIESCRIVSRICCHKKKAAIEENVTEAERGNLSGTGEKTKAFGSSSNECKQKLEEKYKKVQKREWFRKGTVAICLAIYLVSFSAFCYEQITFPVDYTLYGQSAQSHMHWYKYEKAIDRAEELTKGEIGIINLNYANVMLYKKISPWGYLEKVKYDGEDPAFRSVISIDRYVFNKMPWEEGTEDMVFVYPYNLEQEIKEAGFETEYVTECYGVAWKKSGL